MFVIRVHLVGWSGPISSGSNKYLKFNQPDDTGKIMWAPILEKAWAKVKGNYEMTEGGFTVSGLRAVTGAPVSTSNVSWDVSE